jgi:hypothetical protein
MVVYLVTSIFELSPGNFKKYAVAYDSIDSALEYVELDMAAQYDGAYAEIMTDDVKDLIRMRGDFFFKYGTAAHYIMIENMDVHSALPDNVDNVIRFSLTEHEIEPVEEGEDGEEGEDEEELMEEEDADAEEEDMEELPENEEEEEDAEEDVEEETPIENTEENTIGIENTGTANGSVNESTIQGLEEEELPEPETVAMNESTEPPINDNNMQGESATQEETSPGMMNANMEEAASAEEEANVSGTATATATNVSELENMNTSMNTSNQTTEPSENTNIPAALRGASESATQAGGKRRTRRKGAKGKRKSRKL